MLVSECPERHQEHEDWSHEKDANSLLVELVIKHWWLSIPVVDLVFLADIKVGNTNHSNWEKSWKEKTIGEAHEDLGKY